MFNHPLHNQIGDLCYDTTVVEVTQLQLVCFHMFIYIIAFNTRMFAMRFAVASVIIHSGGGDDQLTDPAPTSAGLSTLKSPSEGSP